MNYIFFFNFNVIISSNVTLQSQGVTFEWLVLVTLVIVIKCAIPHGCHNCHMYNIMFELTR